MRWIFYISIGLLSVGPGIADADNSHWAFQSVQKVEPPEVRDAAWRGHAIDRFIAAQLEKKGLVPAEPASDAAWLRRLSYDLTGLPPAPEDVVAFLKQPDRGKAVDRLLASPHFGERWGRMWLDAVRYADSNGQDENKAMANAWRYRDWVVNAFNADLPYQAFLQHQLAGDLIEGGSEQERLARLVATGFLVIGPKILAEQDKEKMVMDIIDEQIDTLGRSMLGITLGCARCHDHKYDPVSIREYYALAGVFHSTQTMADRNHVSKWNERSIATGADHQELRDYEKRKAENTKAIAALRKQADEALRERLIETFVAEPPSWVAKEPAHSPLRTLAPEALSKLLRNVPNKQAKVRLAAGHDGFALNGATKSVVNVSHSEALEPDVFTIECRVKLLRKVSDKSDDRRWLVNKNQNEWVAGHYGLMLHDGGVYAYLAPEGGQGKQVRAHGPSGRIKPGKWHHLAMTFGNGELAVWLDGKKQASERVAKPRQKNRYPLRIGGREDGYAYFEEGLIDSVRMYNRVLSASEMQARVARPAVEITNGLVLREDFEPRDDGERLQYTHVELAGRLYRKGGPLHVHRDGWRDEDKAGMADLEAEQKRLAKPPALPTAMAVSDAMVKPLPVFVRGNHLKREANPVPLGLPVRLSNDATTPPTIPAGQSGRLQLAEWLADDHPLTGRVWVNRIWQSLFGRGLVASADNFGPSGEVPTHPELLDWMVGELHRNQGSTKALIRQIVLSKSYGQSLEPGSERAWEVDPDARWLSRMPRRRLSAEMIRDSLFAFSGALDRRLGGSVTSFKNHDYVRNEERVYGVNRRALYLPVIRDRVNPMLSTFDFSNASASCSRRQESEVALQALFFMNAPMVHEQCKVWAERLLNDFPEFDARVRHLYLQVVAREPVAGERELALQFVERHPATNKVQSWADLCQTLFATNEMIFIP